MLQETLKLKELLSTIIDKSTTFNPTPPIVLSGVGQSMYDIHLATEASTVYFLKRR